MPLFNSNAPLVANRIRNKYVFKYSFFIGGSFMSLIRSIVFFVYCNSRSIFHTLYLYCDGIVMSEASRKQPIYLSCFRYRLATIGKNKISSVFPGLLINHCQTALDEVCSLIIEMSIDFHFSRSQLMRYMNRVVRINQTLKDDWCSVLKEIEEPREKLLFTLTRFMDAYHLKKRRETIIFPSFLTRILNSFRSSFINNVSSDYKKLVDVKIEHTGSHYCGY